MKKYRILFICDKKYDYQYYKATQLKKHLVSDFEVGICCLSNDKIDNFKNFDVYFLFDEKSINPQLHNIHSNKKIVGISSQSYSSDVFKESFAVHTNNVNLYNSLHDKHSNLCYLPDGVDEKKFETSIDPSLIDKNRIIVGITASDDFRRKITDKAKYRHIIFGSSSRNDEVTNLYKKVDIMVFESKNNINPLPVLEFAACGKPIIIKSSSSTTNFPEENHNGFIVSGRDVQKYINKIEYFENNRPEIIRMGTNARKDIESGWTWKTQAEKYKDLLWENISFNKNPQAKSNIQKRNEKLRRPAKINEKPKARVSGERITKPLFKEPTETSSTTSKPTGSQKKISFLKKEIRRLLKIEKALINKRDELKLRTKLVRDDVKKLKKDG